MAFKGKANKGSGSQWYDADVVYGNSGGFQYGKSAHVKTSGVWQQVWTDCRQHDAAGGRDWTAAAGVTEYQNTCNNRETRVRTDYSKTGCAGYSRYTAWVSSPDCNSGCFTQSAIQTTSRGCGCSGSESGTYYTYTANAGSGCTTYNSATSWSGTCTGDCSTGDADCFTTSTVNVERACGACGREPGSYTHYEPKAGTGCTASDSATSWSGTCNSGWVQQIPIYPFSSSVLYNFLGDGVDWYALYNYGGYTPSNNLHGNGCSGSAYALWNLYQCSHGYTENSRDGRYEVNTGGCGFF